MRRTHLILSALILPGAAAAAPEREASVVDRLTECRAITPADARLACYDRAADRIAAARGTGELLVVEREAVIERRRRGFGLGSTGDMFAGGPEDAATAVKELRTSVRAVAPSSVPGRFDMEMANGTVWQTVDPLPFPPGTGEVVMLRTATLGGYRATFGTKTRSFLVKRLR